MKTLISILFLLTFMGELVLDPSTTFVRSSSSAPGFTEKDSTDQRADFDSGSEANESSNSKSAKESLETATAHSALPAYTYGAHVWPVVKSIARTSFIIIPVLSPPVVRIERPPIA